MISRRQYLYSITAGIGAALLPQTTLAEPTIPDTKLFESGDFVWPKKPGQYVPYEAGKLQIVEADQRQWRNERDQFISDVARKAHILRHRRLKG